MKDVSYFVKAIEYKDIVTKSGQGQTQKGYEVSLMASNKVVKVIPIFDFIFKKKEFADLKKDIEQIIDALATQETVSVTASYDDSGKYMTLTRLKLMDEKETKHIIKNTVTDKDRQGSIERQNALTNATSIMNAFVTAGIFDFLIRAEDGSVSINSGLIAHHITEVANKLLEFHNK